MPNDPTAQPWTGATYNGFAGPTAAPAAEPERPRTPRGALLGAIACAIAGAVIFGLWARPTPDERRAVIPRDAVIEAEPAVPIEVVKPEPEPLPKPDGPLEVLPADLAAAAEAARPVAPSKPRPAPVRQARAEPAPAPAPSSVPSSVPEPSAAVLAPPRIVAPRAAPPRAAPPRPAPPPQRVQAEPSFNCARARSPAERMVCGDAELAALDRRLARAFDRAVESGVPYRPLRREEDDWLMIREDAARHSPAAVASVYRQRIGELNAIAEGGY